MPPAKVDREDAAANVISSATGVIREMEVYSGQPLVKVGEAVWEGRMLVSGIFASNQHTLMRYARAKVIAEVEESITITIPLRQEQKLFTGDVINRFLLITPNSVYTLNPWTEIPETSDLSAKTFPLPFGISLIKEAYNTWETKSVSLNRESAKEEALRQLESREAEQFENGYLTRELHGSLENGAFVLTANYTCLKNVAVTQEILTEHE